MVKYRQPWVKGWNDDPVFRSRNVQVYGSPRTLLDGWRRSNPGPGAKNSNSTTFKEISNAIAQQDRKLLIKADMTVQSSDLGYLAGRDALTCGAYFREVQQSGLIPQSQPSTIEVISEQIGGGETIRRRLKQYYRKCYSSHV